MNDDADPVIRTRPAITSTIAVLALLCAAIAVGRLRFIRDLPDWDVATYALVGNEMAHGERLYADIWDMKPPGIFASFALAEWITRGSHEWSAYLLSVVASITTTIAIYFAGAAVARQPAPSRNSLTPLPVRRERRGEGLPQPHGLWAATIWTCVSLQPALGGSLPNTEAFINAFFAMAVAAALSRRMILAGIALAIATLFKQVAIAPAIALAGWMLFPKFERPRQVFLMLAIIPLAWIVVFAHFALTGRGDLFYQTNFVYSRFYGGNIASNLIAGWHVPSAMIEVLPLVLVALVGLISSTHRSLFIALFVGTFIAVAMPGQFFEHYYQLWLVPLSLAAAYALVSMKPGLSITTGSIVCIGLLILQVHWWILSPRDRAAALHPASFFLNVADTGHELRSLLRDDETMFAWCDEPQLYWLAGKRPPATGLWKKHMTEGPMTRWLTNKTLADLQNHPPDLVVTWSADPDQNADPVGRWIADHYQPIPGNPKRLPLALFARSGSDLSHRTNAALP